MTTTPCCSVDEVVEWARSNRDYLGGTVQVNITIDEQPVEITFDGGETYVAAVWDGDPGTTRNWLAYVTPEDLPAAMTVEVLAHITDDSDPGHPIDAHIPCGTITFT